MRIEGPLGICQVSVRTEFTVKIYSVLESKSECVGSHSHAPWNMSGMRTGK